MRRRKRCARRSSRSFTAAPRISSCTTISRRGMRMVGRFRRRFGVLKDALSRVAEGVRRSGLPSRRRSWRCRTFNSKLKTPNPKPERSSMLLCLDVGNSQIHGGVFDGGLRLQFRKTTHPLGSSDEFGVFFTAVLRENGVDPSAVRRVAICSVVPSALYPIRGACVKYFRCEPFVLQAGVKTGLKVKYRNPHEVGADRIAGAI